MFRISEKVIIKIKNFLSGFDFDSHTALAGCVASQDFAGCNGSCFGCTGSCVDSCSGTCLGDCSGCSGSCQGGCEGCQGGCRGLS